MTLERLKPCRHCGHPLAPSAKHCPHCGGPSAGQSLKETGNALTGCGCLIMLIGLLLLAPILFF